MAKAVSAVQMEQGPRKASTSVISQLSMKKKPFSKTHTHAVLSLDVPEHGNVTWMVSWCCHFLATCK